MEALVRKHSPLASLLVATRAMQAYDSAQDKYYCDLMCYVCDGWENKPCLLSGKIHMRMMMAQCLGLGKLLSDFNPIGKWAETQDLILDPADAPPEYRRGGLREQQH